MRVQEHSVVNKRKEMRTENYECKYCRCDTIGPHVVIKKKKKKRKYHEMMKWHFRKQFFFPSSAYFVASFSV